MYGASRSHPVRTCVSRSMHMQHSFWYPYDVISYSRGIGGMAGDTRWVTGWSLERTWVGRLLALLLWLHQALPLCGWVLVPITSNTLPDSREPSVCRPYAEIGEPGVVCSSHVQQSWAALSFGESEMALLQHVSTGWVPGHQMARLVRPSGPRFPKSYSG